MRKLKILVLLIAIISLHSCKKNTDSSSDSIIDDVATSDEYSDGTYCAEVTYFNSGSGTRSTYTLNVEVESREITLIHWPNGGWLDESHFSPQKIDKNGKCSFTSDKGYQYKIQISGPECSHTDESKMTKDLEDDRIAVTCPNCGGGKETYENYCNSCVQFAKNACPKCGVQKSSYDDLCDYCYKSSHRCLRCGEIKEILSPVEKFCPDCMISHEKFKASY